MNDYSKISPTLLKGTDIENINSYIECIIKAKEGIPAEIILNFKEHFHLSKSTTAIMLGVSLTKLNSMLRQRKTLQEEMVILLFEITSFISYGVKVFGNRDKFFRWLETSNIMLSGFKPIEIIHLPKGVSTIDNLLLAIEHDFPA